MTSRSDRPERPLAGRVAMITGGGRGIGRAVAELLAGAGAAVAPLARSAAELESVAGSVRSAGGQAPARPIVCDVTRRADVDAALARVTEELGPPDILVTAAGVARFEPVEATSVEAWNEQLAVNLTGTFHAVQALLPGLRRRRTGDIVTIASVAAIKVFTSDAAYSAAKAGVVAFSRVLREEVRADGIRVTTLIPGATDTELWGPEPPAPPDRMMPAELVARSVLFALTVDPRGCVEEIVLRPRLGDL